MLSAEVHLQKMCNRNFIPQNVRSHILPSKNTEQVVLVPTTCFYLQLRNIQSAMADDATRRAVSEIPLLKTNSGPRDKELWVQRLREEYLALIKYVENNKTADNDWFRLESNKEGTRWFGKCWYIHDLLKYEFDMEFDIPVTYPSTAPEVAIPELDGKTAKMYRGGKICLTDHFKPLWARNVPKFGLAHLMALGLGPWLAVEIPDLISKGLITHREQQGS
ncbi:ubiquitin-fold modifier-conjugating enzyme 1 isoform X1 [Oncorhynchus clarkii lewisi]|uniref:ubiquitin-fold modifier-conjugating enzyme 1 isoform X1 n=1 Tax=Oncorhynchus clarkii lewisi TaxID=490388 RepID=UPI0039B8F72D